ncbi:DUF3568 family protein [Desulfonatronovibrio hydrogenovorans]|uniref:DUF3568 family protein n=1 Tax=Desulfonatronovibrio hydrogenovorans TaxID=53245 RepID=UPI000559847C|nr:DUF3568 family protein [Desulfonatronovibrio hydrogenovorans]
MKPLQQTISIFLITVLCLGLAGCWFAVGGAAGGGTAIYFKGRLQENISRNMHQVHEASLAALQTMEMAVLEQDKKVDSTSIRAQYPDGTNVWINTKYLSTNTTQVRIRVGVLGDEPRSRRIWEEIRRHLP